MTADVEERLREGIDRLTAGASIPAGLVSRAGQRNRRRRIALRTTAASGTALAAVVAVMVATAGGGVPRREAGVVAARTTAYVVARTDQALAAAQRGDAVEQARTAGRYWSSQPASRAGEAASQTMSWYYRSQSRWKGFTADGRALFDGNETAIRSAPGGQRWAGVAVDYQAKTWWHGIAGKGYVPGGPARASSCSTFAPDPIAAGPGEAAQIREALTCGQFKAAGKQQVDGMDAIKLVSAKPLEDAGERGLRFTLWVDPATYLPARTRWSWPARPGEPGSIQADFRWLRPTRVNRAALTVPIPAGFREVPPPAHTLDSQDPFAPLFTITSYVPR